MFLLYTLPLGIQNLHPLPVLIWDSNFWQFEGQWIEHLHIFDEKRENYVNWTSVVCSKTVLV